MRILLFFDLPVETTFQRRQYTTFRKMLIKEGFLMLQESVYSKLVITPAAAELVCKKLRKNKPNEGIVQLLTVTEKQFASIENLVGNVTQSEINNMDRLVVL